MIDDTFMLMNYIGKGGSSKVFLVKDCRGQKVVLKVIRKDKRYMREDAERMLFKEHSVLQKLQSHPNIINSYGVKVDGIAIMEEEKEDIMYGILEHAKHGSIANFIRYTGGIEEDIAKFFMLQTCNAIEFIHQQGYAHLDIKLENILLDEFFNIKVADMGASINVQETLGWTDKRRGTKYYMAPEVASKSPKASYDAFKADIFSLGISLFVLLIGEFPNLGKLRDFSSTEGSEESSSLLQRQDHNLGTLKRFKNLSPDLQTLIKSMTDANPENRPTISEILENSWLCEVFSEKFREEVHSEMNARKEFMLDSSF
ncbi:unnamed protein product [Moneuplotes crassus]|uniref:non-specific serine/threonine protein kinase n=1 Tax=Euplotes crassus TaxID=5936 RepID=A0AAD1Y7W4_EUPCR|nr:unnamed protein product [Moneuplotes crassus]